MNVMKSIKQIIFMIIAIPFLAATSLCQQTELDEVINSGKYIWGRGHSKFYEEADKLALDNLASNISVTVESSFENIVEETRDSISEYTRSSINTYSFLTMHNAKKMDIPDSAGFTVMRYMLKSEKDSIFNARKIRIFSHVNSGEAAEEDLRIGDALMNYYHALIFLRSHPENQTITAKDQGQPGFLLSAYLYEKIKEIFSNIDVSVVKHVRNEKENKLTYILNFRYLGEPVTHLDFKYWSGKQYQTTNCKNGVGRIVLYGNNNVEFDSFRLLIEYMYKREWNDDPDLNGVFNNPGGLVYVDRSEIIIYLPQDAETRQSKDIDYIFDEVNILEKDSVYHIVIQKVLEGITNQDHVAIKPLFTDEGYDMFLKLIHRGNVEILPHNDTLSVIKIQDDIMVRSIPMAFSHDNNNVTFNESVVFIFNNDYKIKAISFSLSDMAISNIVDKPEKFGTIENKYQIINFMEYYKTAYCLKRLDYIESIFANNALIIVGHVLKQGEPLASYYKGIEGNKVKYIYHTKESYIRALERTFAKNDFVNIRFQETDVKCHNNEKVYGIQIAQEYYSTYYADKGYLFLKLDMRDTSNPQIYVRTWQPTRDEKGGIIGIEDFYE